MIGGWADQLIGGRCVYAEQAVVVGAVQQLVQLVERPAGRVPRQEGRLLRQVANQLQGDALWEVPGPGGKGDGAQVSGGLAVSSVPQIFFININVPKISTTFYIIDTKFIKTHSLKKIKRK